LFYCQPIAPFLPPFFKFCATRFPSLFHPRYLNMGVKRHGAESHLSPTQKSKSRRPDLFGVQCWPAIACKQNGGRVRSTAPLNKPCDKRTNNPLTDRIKQGSRLKTDRQTRLQCYRQIHKSMEFPSSIPTVCFC
jgi:hypothetical protein